jgi:hypothetical protein
MPLRAFPSDLSDISSANLERLSGCLWAGRMSEGKNKRRDKFRLQIARVRKYVGEIGK